MATLTNQPAVAKRKKTHAKFYLIFGLLIWAAVFYGFYQSFYLNHWFETPPGMRSLTPLYLAHGTIFSFWIALAVIQPALIVAKNRRLHRRVGWLAVGVAAAVILIGNVAAIEALNYGFADAPDREAFYAVPVFDMLVFGTCVALGVWWRNYAETHKRLMILSYTQLLHAAVGRYPVAILISYAPWSMLLGTDLVVIGAGASYDLATRGKVHRVWLIGGGLVLASEFARLALGQTAAWHRLATSMASIWPY